MFRNRTLASLVLSACALGAFAPPAMADAGGVTRRPIGDFVNAQGTFAGPIPPWANYGEWFNHDNGLIAQVDYAGVADDYLGGVLGTSYAGTVTERQLPDGRCLVRVVLHTHDALAYVSPWPQFRPDWWEAFDETVFGATPLDVLDGAEPVLAESLLKVEFIVPHSGAPLPDLMQILFAPQPGQEILTISQSATARGVLADGGTALLKMDGAIDVPTFTFSFSIELTPVGKP